MNFTRTVAALFVVLCIHPLAAQKTKTPTLPSETPAKFEPTYDGFDHVRREVKIPMRDGVKLHTVILVPKGALGKGNGNAPILLTRTPYDADGLTTHSNSNQLGPSLFGYDNATDVIVEGGYIRVVQDVRGKYGSEGEYVMNRPLRGPLNSTSVDHSTDAWDTIDWLVKNVPESNGRVGTIGTSYNGFTALMSLVNPHPALKASVPINPMVDVWKGDDWFHNGAFRQQMISYVYGQTAAKDSDEQWFTGGYDDYAAFLRYGSAAAYGRAVGMEQLPFWRRLLQHPDYDEYWQSQAMDRILSARPLTVLSSPASTRVTLSGSSARAASSLAAFSLRVPLLLSSMPIERSV